jgi:hypothetical protein
MRHALLVLALAGFAGTALADDARWVEDGYVPQLTLQAAFGSTGVKALRLQGVDLMSPPTLAANATEGGLTVGQWVGIGFTAVVFAVIAVEAADEDEDPVTGTGAN